MKSLPLICGVPLLVASAVCAAADVSDLADLSLEELMKEPVTSVSKKATRLAESPAAITVITAEDIRRLGITTLPEALRLVPGLAVARTTANEWAITARGFQYEFANKLLVLIDGRVVYTPMSGGVFWNAQDVMLEDLDRIEVIRGPGATLWGANAVNGVINIITKHSADTQGGLVTASAGTEEQPLATARFGASLNDDLSFRVFGKYFNRDGLVDSDGHEAPGAWHAAHGGFRTDWTPTTQDALVFQGDYYDGRADKSVNSVSLAPAALKAVDITAHNTGSDVLGRWTRQWSETSALSVQAFVDHVEQGDGFVGEKRDTFDVELQHRFALGARNDVMWGVGYRSADLEAEQSFDLIWTPAVRHLSLANLFLQDELTLVPDRVRVTVGSKFEHNNLVGSSVQPNLRALWTPTPTQTVWAAASRATRTPDLFELGGRINAAAFETGPNTPPVLVAYFGNPALEAEKLTSYEVGYRVTPTSELSIDVAVYDNWYRNLVTYPAGATQIELNPAPIHVLMPFTADNSGSARTYGLEISAQWRPVKGWRLVGSYSYLHMRFLPDPRVDQQSPEQQFQVRSYFDVSSRLEVNSALFYVDPIASVVTSGAAARVPSYVRFDLGMSWKPAAFWSIGLWGQNLLDSRHIESSSSISEVQTEVPRGVVARVTRSF